MLSTGNLSIPIRKSDEQIEFYQENGKKFNDVLRILREIIKSKKGVTGFDLRNIYVDECINHFSIDIGFPFKIQKSVQDEKFYWELCISNDDVVAHGRFEEELKPGAIISIDCGLALRLDKRVMHFDAAFTEQVGLKETEKWIYAPLQALKMIAKDKSLQKTSDISSIIEATAMKNGVNIVNALTGHGSGYSLHEAPYIYNCTGGFSDVTMFNNLCLCAEPIYVKRNKKSKEIEIEKVYVNEDQWAVHTISERPSSHFETMFCYKDGRLIDLIGLTEW